MSADNYLLIRRNKGQYVLTQEFASDPRPSSLKSTRAKRFDSLQEAFRAAEDFGYTEYGIEVSRAVSSDLKKLRGELAL